MNTRFENFSIDDFLLEESFLAYCQGDRQAGIFWEKWALEHPGKAREVAEAKRLFYILHGAVPGSFVMEDRMRLKMVLEKRTMPVVPANTTMPERRKSVYRIAAVIVFLLVCGAAIFWSINKGKRDGWFPSASELVYTNGGDAKKTIVLPDSTIILLNRFSAIRIDPGYGERDRMLELVNGSAYFEVRPDADRPFVVKSGTFQTIALGTAFLVRSNAVRKNIQVSLVAGKVKVEGAKSKKNTAVYLLPGERALAGEKRDSIVKNKFSISEVEDWKNNVITFTNASFGQVIRKLEEWYELEVHINGRIPENKHYTARFENKSLQSVMEAIAYSHGFRYRMEENNIVIDFD